MILCACLIPQILQHEDASKRKWDKPRITHAEEYKLFANKTIYNAQNMFSVHMLALYHSIIDIFSTTKRPKCVILCTK